MTKKLIALTAFILSILSYSVLAFAANGEGFTIVSANPNTINPRKFIFELKPGKSETDYVEVQNMADTTETFLLYGADPTFSAQGTPAYKTRQSGGNGEGQWIQFEQSEITLTPGEKRIVKFTVQIPKTAAKGDYRAGVAMEKTARPSADQPGISIATRIILHAEIKVTDKPRVIPHVGTVVSVNGEQVVPVQASDWRAIYFWISLGLFILSFIALLWITLAECFAAKKRKTDTPKTSVAQKTVQITGTPKPTRAKKSRARKRKPAPKQRAGKSLAKKTPTRKPKSGRSAKPASKKAPSTKSKTPKTRARQRKSSAKKSA